MTGGLESAILVGSAPTVFGLGDATTTVFGLGDATTTVFGLDDATTTFLLGLTSALLGAFVAWTAYRGYVRNDSRPMLYLSIGVVFLTTIPFVLAHAIDRLTTATDAEVLLAITACHLIGLVAVVTSLRRPDRS